MDVSVLFDFNPWWVKGVVPNIFLGNRKRPVFDEIEALVDKRFIVLLYGLRRVGKTTLFYQTIQFLIERNVNPANILYFSFDEKSASVQEIVDEFEAKVLKKRIVDCKEKIFFFFDEIQKVEDWQNKIKILYDLHPALKIFLSGSASVSIQKKATESLAGRMFDIFVQPLSFAEFLEWKGIKVDKSKPELFQKEINPQLMDYLRKGGFPEIVSEDSDENIRNYVKNAVIERVLYKDIPEEFSLKDLELLKVLLNAFIQEPGMIVNSEKLAHDLGKSKITIGNYIEYLEFSLLITKIENLRSNFLVSSRKGKKIYPTNTAFCFAYRTDFYSNKVLEKIAEVSVANHLQAQYYYRNGFEIDFIQKATNQTIIPIEVKYGEPEQNQVKKFMQKFNKTKKAIIVSKETNQPEKEGITIIPLWLFLLEEKT